MEQQAEDFNYWEKQLISEDKLQLIIHDSLPKEIKFVPPQKNIPQAASTTNCPDGTLTKKQVQLQRLFVLCMVLAGGIIYWIATTSTKREAKDGFHSSGNNATLTKTSSRIITANDIENTMQGDGSGNAKTNKTSAGNVKVGDQVSYEDGLTQEQIQQNGKRNFNTPLLIQSDSSGGGFGSGARRPSLPIAKNSYVRVFLENEINSQNLDIPVTAITYMDLTNNGHVMIPKDAKLIGSSAQPRDSNRVQIRFDSVIFPDGKEYSIKGIALGEDNAAGVAANVDYKLAKKGSSLLASSLLSAASNTLLVGGSGGFAPTFAGSMAGNTSNAMGNALDYESRSNGLSLSIPISTRFKIVFE